MERYIGKLLDGRYEILEIIGVGGMAVVYKAMDHRLNRLVAVKILRDEYTTDPDFRRRFHGESQAVAMMSHPNIVSVYDVSKNEGMDYIVMELIDGITLKQYMDQKGTLSWRETLHFSMQIAKALEHAHSRSIIHRDIKPHNVMILKDGSVKVADFGIARIASATNTLTKEALGSVHYISPEQAKGARVDARTDIYSLGVVMYEMLTGRTPYDGETPVAVAIQHINGTPLSPSLLNSEIPIGLEQITMHAMCSDLNIRYATIGDMLADMEEFRKNPAIHFTFLPVNPQGDGQNTSRVQPRRGQNTRNPSGGSHETSRQREVIRQNPADKTRRVVILAAIAVVAAALVLLLVILPKNADPAANATTDPGSSTADSETAKLYIPPLIGSIWDEIPKDAYQGLHLVVNERSWVYNSEWPGGVICDQSIPAGEPYQPGTELFLYVSLGEKTDQMPELSSQTMENARKILEALSVEITILNDTEYSDTVKEGSITRTEPPAGSTLKDGQYVTVFTSLGRETKLVEVPSVQGTAATNAIVVLDARHLNYASTEEYSSTVAAGYVVSQDPAAFTEVEEGTVVHLVISKGKEIVTMVSVVGDGENSAAQTLTNMNLVVEIEREYSASVPEGVVIRQSAAAGAELYPGTVVTLTVSRGAEPTEPPPTEPPPTEPPVTEPPATEPPVTEPPVTEPPATEPGPAPSPSESEQPNPGEPEPTSAPQP